MAKKQKYIAHIDMDAFFAAIEARDKDQYKNKPVIIGSDPQQGKGRGVVATCSYEAREYGVHSAMPISIAYKKCPGGVFLRPNMEKYSNVSRDIYEIFYAFTPEIEPVSIDEAFLDITNTAHLFGGPIRACKKIKEKIFLDTGLTASCGLAPSKMTAKIASDIEKPDGFVRVAPKDVKAFLYPLDIGKLWGIGPKTAKALRSYGINKIKDIANSDISFLENILGSRASFFIEIANGKGDSSVVVGQENKSISNELTFVKDTSDLPKIFSAIMKLSEKISQRMRIENLYTDAVTLKIRYDDFTTFSRTHKLFYHTNYVDDIFKVSKKLFLEHSNKKNKIRLVGIKIGNINKNFTKDLFSEKENKTKEKIHCVVEKINKKLGSEKICRAASCEDE